MAYVDIAVLAIAALFIIIGLVKGFIKPLVSVIGWGLSFAGIYFFAGKISSILLGTGLNGILTGLVQKFVSDAASITQIVDYLGLTISTVAILLVVGILVAIINAILVKITYARKTALNRLFGGLLYFVKGVFVIFILLTVTTTLLQAIGKQEIIDMYITNSTITKFLVQYNPINMIFDIILKTA